MSLWQRETHCVVLGDGWLRRLGSAGEVYEAPSEYPTAWQRIAAVVNAYIQASGAKSLILLLSPELLQHALTPGLRHWLSENDLKEIAAGKLANIFGTSDEDRLIEVSRGEFNAPGIAMSVSKVLVENLYKVLSELDCRSIVIKPEIGLALPSFRAIVAKRQDAVLWLPGKTGTLIGVMKGGVWQSLRMLPQSLLRNASAKSLIELECLAAGLPSPSQLVTTEPRKENEGISGRLWQVEDIHARWQAAKSRKFPTFMPKHRKIRATGVVIMMVACVTAGLTLDRIQKIQLRRADVEARVAAFETQSETRAKSQKARDEVANRSFELALSAYRTQLRPWDKMIEALNDCISQESGVIAIRANANERSFSIEGAAEDYSAVQQLADKMAAHDSFSEVKIASAALAADSFSMRVRYLIQAIPRGLQ